jgi:hypothetical protein
MSARCPVCHAALDVQFEQVTESGATCHGCGSQVQAFERDSASVSMPSSKQRHVSPTKPAYAENRRAGWWAKA